MPRAERSSVICGARHAAVSTIGGTEQSLGFSGQYGSLEVASSSSSLLLTDLPLNW